MNSSRVICDEFSLSMALKKSDNSARDSEKFKPKVKKGKKKKIKV